MATTIPKHTPEERLNQLKRERTLIVAALDECRLALHKGQDSAFIAGRLMGTLETIIGSPSPVPIRQQVDAAPPQAASKRPISKQVLLTKKELCEHLGFRDTKSIDTLVQQKKIPFLKLGYKSALICAKCRLLLVALKRRLLASARIRGNDCSMATNCQELPNCAPRIALFPPEMTTSETLINIRSCRCKTLKFKGFTQMR